jgi:hypothetical protein
VARLKVRKVKLKRPKVKRGKTVKIKVTAKNVGGTKTSNAKLCLKIKGGVKKKLKPKGKSRKKLGSLAPGKAKTRALKLKATKNAKKGKKYKATIKLNGKGANAVTKAVRVKVR